MVSIAAFQAVDPGSIPGRRILFRFFQFFFDQSDSEKYPWEIVFGGIFMRYVHIAKHLYLAK